MVTKLRRNTTLAAAVLATGAIALATPGMANSLGHHDKAGKVNAKQVSRAYYFANGTFTDNFNTCAYTPLLSKAFAVPRAGVVTVAGTVTAERDFDNAAAGLLTFRISIDGTPVTVPTQLRLDGGDDYNTTTIGGAKVTKGAHTLVVEAKECGPGMAFVLSESATVNFSNAGAANATVPSLKAKSAQQ
ncbi:MAG: hypothetical protein KDB63_13435 [Nocardioidaceae bacterium]|nr:hypothetical protein [Nocardioidaceae bacterium]